MKYLDWVRKQPCSINDTMSCMQNRRSSKLNTKEFNEYLECCCRWAATEGIYIPDPDGYFKSNPVK